MNTLIARACRAALPALLIACPLASRAQATHATPEAVFTLEPQRTRWAIRVEVGGRPFRFGLDTGGGLTLISPSVVDAAGCTPWGRVTGYQMMGARLDSPRCDNVPIDIGGHRFVSPVALVLPPSAVESKDTDLQGSLALDAFAGRAITLDLAGGHLTVESKASLAERVRGMTPLAIRFSREAGGRSITPLTAVPTAKGMLWMELDSGNGGTMLVSKPYAALVGLDSANADMQKGGFQLQNNVRVESDRFLVKDMIIDGNIGTPFMRHWIITLDLATERAWIAPAAEH
jgi:hypothetical protein